MITNPKNVILVVDDEPTNLKVLYKVLTDSNFEVLVLQDGETALELLNRRKVDLILLDIIMPEMDGFEVAKRIKSQSRISGIPIIFMSALSDTVNKVKGFKAGAIDYLTKPFQKEEVIARINTHLDLRRHQSELAEINAHKDKLFSILSHDLRSPFASIIELGRMLSAIEDDFEINEIREIGDKIAESGGNTLKLLENLLAWSRVQQENHIKLSQTNLYAHVIENIVLYKEQINSKQITLENDLSKNIYVLADENMLSTIIRNVISNAVKFSFKGSKIYIKTEENEDRYILSIRDEGSGISETDMNKLFNIYEKLSKRGTDGERGTGLGLILCKEFAGKIDGEFEIISKPGEGTEVKLSLKKDTELINV